MAQMATITIIRNHADYTKGQVVEVPADYGARLICSGVAVMGRVEPKPEPEPEPAPEEPEIETAMSRPRTPRKKRAKHGDQSS